MFAAFLGIGGDGGEDDERTVVGDVEVKPHGGGCRGDTGEEGAAAVAAAKHEVARRQAWGSKRTAVG